MDKKALEAFAREAAKSIKTESDLDDFRKMLIKVTIETALNAELDEHLGRRIFHVLAQIFNFFRCEVLVHLGLVAQNWMIWLLFSFSAPLWPI